jgi:hypothetical protein
MPIMTLDEKTALVAIDTQQSILAIPYAGELRADVLAKL